MDYIKTAASIADTAKKAGEQIKRAGSYDIYQKEGHANFVTSADIASQKLITSELSSLIEGANFVGEEDKDEHELAPGYNWIIDPIDGTTNFIRGFGHSSISIALVKDGVAQIGVVHDPFLNETFTAVRGKGSFLNGRPIHAADTEWANTLIIFGTTPYESKKHRATYEILADIGGSCGDVRRTGSAALDLSYIAAGRADGFYELKLQIWDFAAGILIAEEAGARAEAIPPDRLDYRRPAGIICAGRTAFSKIKEAILRHI